MEKAGRDLLMIFYRNPRMGMVKTRLAATVGDHKALAVYVALCRHTISVTEILPFDKMVFYADAVENDDMWPDEAYHKAAQSGMDLGERMSNAFRAGFTAGYRSICIIGTDCYELTGAIIQQAFEALHSYDAVIGPAEDGGYYLLGLRQLQSELFIKKQWSTDSVFIETLENFDSAGIRYLTLPLLRDVDVEDDLPSELRKLL
jgi:uncharacterized protein